MSIIEREGNLGLEASQVSLVEPESANNEPEAPFPVEDEHEKLSPFHPRRVIQSIKKTIEYLRANTPPQDPNYRKDYPNSLPDPNQTLEHRYRR